jgi:hypothetical protein
MNANQENNITPDHPQNKQDQRDNQQIQPSQPTPTSPQLHEAALHGVAGRVVRLAALQQARMEAE